MNEKKLVKLSKYLTPIFQTPSKELSEWFGYYNYDTMNTDNTKMLCGRSIWDGVSPDRCMTIELGYYNILSSDWHNIGVSDSWNWQQGAMLQWLPGGGHENKVIYNTSKDGHLVSVIHDIYTKEDKTISWPIYGITPDGGHSISLDLERSYWCRAYHYQSVANTEKNGRVYGGDGIFEINLETNERRRIIQIQEIIALDTRPYFQSCKHWLEHIMISPNGKRICFLHRFSPEYNVYQYQTRLCIADIDGRNLQVVPGWEKQNLSHFGWKNDDEFVIYTVLSSPLSVGISNDTSLSEKAKIKRGAYQLAKSLLPDAFVRMLRAKDKGYYHYRISEGTIQLKEKWQGKNLDIDGHPSFTKDGRYMITDSYPDMKGYQRLLVYDTVTKKSLVVGRFFASYKGNPASCDLHPKLCKNNDYLVVDTAYDKQHHMILFKINWKTIKEKLSA